MSVCLCCCPGHPVCTGSQLRLVCGCPWNFHPDQPSASSHQWHADEVLEEDGAFDTKSSSRCLLWWRLYNLNMRSQDLHWFRIEHNILCCVACLVCCSAVPTSGAYTAVFTCSTVHICNRPCHMTFACAHIRVGSSRCRTDFSLLSWLCLSVLLVRLVWIVVVSELLWRHRPLSVWP